MAGQSSALNGLATLFKALTDETRLRIIKLLEGGELCVCDIVAALGMSQPKVSFHLNVLKEAGFIKDRKQGKWSHYSIDAAEVFKRLLVLSVLERMSGDVWAEDRRRLKAFLVAKDSKGSPVGLDEKKSRLGRCR